MIGKKVGIMRKVAKDVLVLWYKSFNLISESIANSLSAVLKRNAQWVIGEFADLCTIQNLSNYLDQEDMEIMEGVISFHERFRFISSRVIDRGYKRCIFDFRWKVEKDEGALASKINLSLGAPVFWDGIWVPFYGRACLDCDSKNNIFQIWFEIDIAIKLFNQTEFLEKTSNHYFEYLLTERLIVDERTFMGSSINRLEGEVELWQVNKKWNEVLVKVYDNWVVYEICYILVWRLANSKFVYFKSFIRSLVQ